MHKRWFVIFVYVVIMGCLFGVMFPIFWLILLSLKSQTQAFTYPPLFLFSPHWKNFRILFTEVKFYRFIINSLIISSGSVFFSLLIGVPTAYALLRAKIRFKKFLLAWNLLTRMVPGMVFIIPYFTVYSAIGLKDTHIGLILMYMIYNLPLVMWIMIPFFDQIPKDLEEAARTDGSSLVHNFIRIILPVSTPGLIACVIFTFIFSWNEFLFAVVMTRSRAVTATVGITHFMAYQGFDWGPMAAGGVLMLLPVIAFAVFIRRYLVKGLLGGAVKY